MGIGIGTFLGKIYRAQTIIVDGLKAMMTGIKGWLGGVGLAICGLLITFRDKAMEWVHQYYETCYGVLMESIHRLAPIVDPSGTFGDGLHWSACFIPYEVILGNAVILFTIESSLLLYRFVKSWIPTLAGS